ncbi:MAG TPA: AMP-binding protein [Spirochaetia bacterium]|nr:AMP-binding protein [Spirochaetia bacterium]HRZ63362.1 AMP-binding protein [Spirochaetia bacterium]
MITDYLDTTIPVFDWKNLNAMFRDITSGFAEHTALRYRARGETAFQEWSYARLGREGEAFASYLLAEGLAAGDRVAIWSENRPEWAVAYMAIVAAGLVAVPIDALLPDEDVARILKAAEVGALVASGKFAKALPALAAALGSLRAFVGLDGAPSPGIGSLAAASWSEASSFSGGPGLPSPDSIAPEALASIIFTSGTTGTPKGVGLSHGGIIANFDASIHSLPIGKEDVFMCVLPLHHTYPTTCCLISPLAVGASVTICEKMVGKVILDDARDSGGTVFIAVPLLYDKLAQGVLQGVRAKPAPVRAAVGALRAVSRTGLALGAPWIGRALLKGFRTQVGLGSARLLVAGGGPLNAATAAIFDELGFTIVQGYGMSENGPLISTNTPRYHDHRSAGLAVKRTRVRIADPNEEGIGEIQVTSPSLMLGYWRDPEATASVFTPDGWLRTGDLGRIDERGYIYITGRIKSMIVTAGGKNIYPEEIEARFDGSRVAREILVVGRSRGESDAAEEVAAVILPDLEAIAADHGAATAADPSRVRELVKAEVERVNRSLPTYKKISDFHLRSKEFEKTSSKKIKRFLYKDWEAALR